MMYTTQENRTGKLLLTCSYINRQENTYTVYRVDGTRTYVLHVNGTFVGEFDRLKTAKNEGRKA